MSRLKSIKPRAERRDDRNQVRQQSQSPYLTSEEAIVYLRLDRLSSPLSALYRLVKEHQLPHGRRGGLYLFDTRELDAWIKGFGSALDMARARKSA
jgi:excisionase family DNA binding protein